MRDLVSDSGANCLFGVVVRVCNYNGVYYEI